MKIIEKRAMTFTINKARFKTETGGKLHDLIVKTGNYDDFAMGFCARSKAIKAEIN